MSVSRGDFPFSCMNQHLKLQQTNGEKGKEIAAEEESRANDALLKEEKKGTLCGIKETCEKGQKSRKTWIENMDIFQQAYPLAILALSAVRSARAEGFEKDSDI